MIVLNLYSLKPEDYKEAISEQNQINLIFDFIEKAFKAEQGRVPPEKMRVVRYQLNSFFKKMTEIKRMKTRDTFGEYALKDPNSVRKATVKCVKDCYFGVLTKQNYDLSIAKIQAQIIDKKVGFIH